MAQNKKNFSASKAASTLSSLVGYILGSILIGLYIDDKYFNNSGIAVLVSSLLGILMAFISIVRMVVSSCVTH